MLKEVFLTSDKSSTAAVYEQAYLNFSLGDQSLQVSIHAQITACEATQ